MILSRGRGYIFVHIPKTGGTSMARALEGRALADDVLIGNTPKARRRRGRVAALQHRARGRLWKHATLADIDGLMSAEEIAARFVFTLVRDPWDRMASLYTWLRGQRFDHPAVHRARALDFAGFLAAPETQAAWAAQPARHYVTDAQGVERCRLFIRLEHWRSDAAPLWEHLGFSLDLPHLNVSRQADHRGLYTTRDAEIVARISAEDIVRFGYSF